MRLKKLLLAIFALLFITANNADSKDPLTRTVYKYGFILDDCVIDGKPLKRDSNGDWGYYVTISHGIDFGSDIDSRWMRIEFQYFPEKRLIEFTVYSSTMSRQGDWKEIVGFRTTLQEKKMDFASADTWQLISFEKEGIKLQFRFYHAKAR